VPLVVGDIASRMEQGTVLKVHLIPGTLFQEGELPFCRLLNRQCQVNIAQDGKPVHQIRACERNYLRIHPDRPLVEVGLSDQLSPPLEADFVYVWDGALANEQEFLARQGYQRQQTLSAGSPAWLVQVYRKGATP